MTDDVCVVQYQAGPVCHARLRVPLMKTTIYRPAHQSLRTWIQYDRLVLPGVQAGTGFDHHFLNFNKF